MASDTLAVLDAIPTDQIPAAIMRLTARVLVPAPATDDLLSVKEAAALLKTSRRWLYNHAAELGVVRLSKRKIVFPRHTILARVARKGRRS